MRMVATIRVESDDGKVSEQAVSSVGVDTRVKGIDPDAAKEDFIAQARGLLTSIGETHVPALYATVQGAVEAGAGQDDAAPDHPEVTDRLQKIRAKRSGQAESQTAAEEPKEQV